MSIIAQGAEAVIRKGQWHGRSVIIKDRVPKAYRTETLDKRLRTARLKTEAQLMAQARTGAGVRTPLIYDIDLASCSMIMEFVEGPTAKTVLQDSHERLNTASQIGASVGRLHRNGIVHGDLTTSNIIVTTDGPCFIDFGLGEKSQELEKKGVDLHLLKEALESAHSEHQGLFEEMTAGYLQEYPEGKAVVRQMHDIEKRGRYR